MSWAQTRHYQPPPCPNCGSTRTVVTEWADDSDFATGPDVWLPVAFDCLDCHGRRQ